MNENKGSTRQLTVITTENCTAKCAHCIMCSSPGLKHTLTFEQIKGAIDAMNEIEPLLLVVFSGGEPTLLGDDLLEAIAYCDSLGILTRIVTNAHWAKTREAAHKYLRTLRESGLNELNISCDDYHSPFIPFEYVKNAWFESKSMGFSAVVIANSHSEGDTITPDYIEEQLGEKINMRYNDNIETVENYKRDQDGTIYILSNSKVQKLGRADDELSENSFECMKNQNDLLVGCRWVANQPALSPTNHLWACCGICGDGNYILDLGDMGKEKLTDILNRAKDDIVINALHYLGPMFLRNFIKTKHPDIDFKEKYSSVCEVCQDFTQNEFAVQALKLYYAELVQYIINMEKIKDGKTVGAK